jgi:hypothetical protein
MKHESSLLVFTSTLDVRILCQINPVKTQIIYIITILILYTPLRLGLHRGLLQQVLSLKYCDVYGVISSDTNLSRVRVSATSN